MNEVVRRSMWNREINYAHIRLDQTGHKVWCEEKECQISTKEYDLLTYLLRNSEHVVTREMIAANVWCYNINNQTTRVNVFIYRLRKKLDCCVDKNLIHTVKGIGYIFKAV